MKTCYVSPSGDDAADGLTWPTAKKTILKAYDELPAAGGTIYILDGSTVGGEIANQGIWLTGDSSPPMGWRAVKAGTRFIGVGSSLTQFGTKGAAQIVGGNGEGFAYNDKTKPVIWIYQTIDSGLSFENLKAQYPAVGIRLGVFPDLVRRNSPTALVRFDNLQIALYNVGVMGDEKGPVVDIGGGVLLIWFEDCVFLGYPGGAGDPIELANPRHAVMLVDPAGGQSSAVNIDNNRWGQGGLVYHVGASSWGFSIKDLLVESDFVNPIPPAVRVVGGDPNGTAICQNIVVADAPDPVSVTGAGSIVCIACAPNPVISGGTILAPYEAAYEAGGVDRPPNAHYQTGFWGRRVAGYHDGGRRLLSPVAVRFPNQAPTSPVTWGSAPDGGAPGDTKIELVADPAGGSNAGRLSRQGETTGRGSKQIVRTSSIAYAAGDAVVVGGWYRGASGAGTYSDDIAPISWFVNAPPSGFGIRLLNGDPRPLPPILKAGVGNVLGGHWEWSSAAAVIIGGGTGETIVQLVYDEEHPMEFYGPIFLHIPTAAGLADAELAELALHLASIPDGVASGIVSTMPSQKLAALGGLCPGDYESGPYTATSVIIGRYGVYDPATGVLRGYVPVYSTIS